MISIFKYKDYTAVGIEGQAKYFLPNMKKKDDYLLNYIIEKLISSKLTKLERKRIDKDIKNVGYFNSTVYSELVDKKKAAIKTYTFSSTLDSAWTKCR